MMYNNINKVIVSSNKFMKYICKHNPTYYNITKLRALSFIMQEYYKTNKFDWSKYINVSDVNNYGYYKYNLPNNKLNKNNYLANLEFNIITWAPGSETILHSHPNMSCLMMPINGGLNQTVAYHQRHMPLYLPKDNDKKYVTTTVFPGQLSYIDDSIGSHKIFNGTDSYAVSFHIYKYLDDIDSTNLDLDTY